MKDGTKLKYLYKKIKEITPVSYNSFYCFLKKNPKIITDLALIMESTYTNYAELLAPQIAEERKKNIYKRLTNLTSHKKKRLKNISIN